MLWPLPMFSIGVLGFVVWSHHMYGSKFVNNARFKNVRQTIKLKNAIKKVAITCSSIGQWTKIKLSAILVPTAIITVHFYRLFVCWHLLLSTIKSSLFSVLIEFIHFLYKIKVFILNKSLTKKLRVWILSKPSDIKLNFIFWRIGNTQNKIIVRRFSSNNKYKKGVKDTNYKKLLSNSKSFKIDLKRLDLNLWKLYLKASNANIIFDARQIKIIHKFIDRYNLLISNWLEYYKINNDFERITNNEYYVPVERLQNIFIESFAICIYSIHITSISSGSQTPGVDNICFKSTKYFEDIYLKKNLQKKKRNHVKYKSTENLKVQRAKIITPELKLQFNKEAKIYNKNLCFQLISQCLLKTFRKNYQAQTVKRIWIPKENKPGLRPLGILTIREKIIQNIILLSSNPILEFCSDQLSFGFRSQRSGTQCISYLFNKLGNSRKLVRKQTYIKRVSKLIYDSTYTNNFTKKIKQRTTIYSKQWPLNQRRFNYIYWIYTNRNKPTRPTLNLYKRIINVGIKKCFDNLSHNSILKYFPITKKYKFLLKAWLKAKIYGPKTELCNSLSFYTPKKGVPQGSIIGPACCNSVLDGLEKHINSTLSKNDRVSLNKKTLNHALKIHNKSNIKHLNDRTSKPYVNIETIRFADDIIIVAKASYIQTEKIVSSLKNFLRIRGLELETPSNQKFFFTFKPGSKLNYLGFTLFFPDFKKPIFKCGKFTKWRPSPDNLGNQRRYDYYRSTILISIQKFKIFTQLRKIREILHRRNSNGELKQIISKLNEQIRGFSNYFNLSRQCRIQLKWLDYIVYKSMKKFLLNKYKSKNKVGKFISQNFLKDGTFYCDNYKLLKHTDIRMFKFRDIRFISNSKDYFNLNIYLDSIKINSSVIRNNFLNALSLLRYNKPLSQNELECILLNHQNYICNICNSSINVEIDNLEVDHKPSIYILSKIALTNILNFIALKLYNRKFIYILNFICFESFTNELINFDIPKYFNNHILNKIRYSLVHKTCNRENGKKISKRSNLTTNFFKRKFNKLAPIFVKETLQIRNKLNSLIRTTYKFNKRQRTKILLS